MNRNLKNEEVKKYITIGAVLIILYWALQNLQLIFSVMSKILTLFMPFPQNTARDGCRFCL